MQADPIIPKLKPPGTRPKRLKLKYCKLLSSFAFNFNLRHFSLELEYYQFEPYTPKDLPAERVSPIVVHCGQGLTLVHVRAQLELSLCPTHPNVTHECVPNVLKLSSNVNECKSLTAGTRRRRASTAGSTSTTRTG